MYLMTSTNQDGDKKVVSVINRGREVAIDIFYVRTGVLRRYFGNRHVMRMFRYVSSWQSL